MKKKLTTLSALAVTSLALPAAVTITGFSQELTSEANDASIAGSVADNSMTGYAPINVGVLATQGVASANATLDILPATTGLPAAENDPVDSFNLQWEAAVNAAVGSSATFPNTANSTVALSFNLVVLDNLAQVSFAQTGSDADFRLIVAGNTATNATQVIFLNPGSYVVKFSDGAGASTDQPNQEDSEQKNFQNYSILVESIPEPSSALLGSLGLLALLRRRR